MTKIEASPLTKANFNSQIGLRERNVEQQDHSCESSSGKSTKSQRVKEVKIKIEEQEKKEKERVHIIPMCTLKCQK